uniref:Glutamate receptor ionotropic, kainate 4-like n=1 Tax=Dermatophagoides pteronyssinus TaxID=6956 RepID=A0A6P6Y9L0_DERPT|nr:glutamate receptor ionotropic, kainate 4-like [Dermatophagoides pteronyssinus]
MSRLDLQNRTLRIGFNNKPPITNIYGWDESMQTYRHIYGTDPFVLNLLARYFNFTYKLIDYHRDYGSLSSNGSWTGTIGQLARNELDLGIGGYAITYERINVIKFLHPHLFGQHTFAMAKITTLPDFDIFFKPFESIVWLCLLITLILSCLLYLVIKYLLPFKHINLIICSLNMLLQQSYPIRKDHLISNSAKIWLFSFAMMSIVLINIYQSYLFSILTITKSNEINNIEKLAESCQKHQTIPYTIKNNYAYEIIRHDNPNSSINTITKYMKFVANYEDGIKMIQKSNSVVFITSRVLLLLSQRYLGQDQLYIPMESQDTNFLTIVGSIICRPTFEYQNEFNRIISYLMNSGIILKIEKQELEQIRDKNQHILQQSYPIRKDHQIILTITKSNEIDNIEKLAESCRKHQTIPYTIKNNFIYHIINQDNPNKSIYTISKYLKFVENYEDGIKMIQKSTSVAFVAARARLLLSQKYLGVDQLYVPMESQETNFITVVASIICRPTFEYTKEFNRM